MSTHETTERDHLLAAVACRSGRVSETQLGCALAESRKESSHDLADILVERGWISQGECAAMRTQVDHLVSLLNASARKKPLDAIEATPLEAAIDPPVETQGPRVPNPEASTVSRCAPDPFAETNAPGDSGFRDADPSRDTQRDRYQNRRFYTKGGIGEIWHVRDTHLGRELVLKRLQSRHRTNMNLVTRFLVEARVTAQLEHPGIVPIYDLLEEELVSDSFYTMRFVGGQTMSKAVHLYHQDRATTGRLELARLLAAFVSICYTVAYAHARGVVHRDIKPSNVVLGDFGEVVVLDWGMAKIRDAPATSESSVQAPRLEPVSVEGYSGLTSAGETPGTAPYMPLEQARGDVEHTDERSDIYALGALLYQILTDRAPYVGSSAEAILRQVLDAPPPSPRSILADVPVPLEAICNKAMARERANRYASARLLAEDVQHWLADEPVSVHRERWIERAGRWSRRHKPFVAGAASLLITAVVALATSTVLIAGEKAKTEQALIASDADHKIARDSVDGMLKDIGDDALAHLPGLGAVRVDCTEKALRYYRKFVARRPNDSEARRRLAQYQSELGLLYRMRGDYDAALHQTKEAERVLTGSDSREPLLPGYTEPLAQTLLQEAETLRTMGKYDEARPLYDRATKLAAQLRTAQPNFSGYGFLQARALWDLAAWHMDVGQFSESEQTSRAALALAEPLLEPARNGDVAFLVAALRGGQGEALRKLGRVAEALPALEQSIKAMENLGNASLPSNDRDYVRAHMLDELASALLDVKRDQEALVQFEQAINLLEPLPARFPDVAIYPLDLAVVHAHRGVCRARLGQNTAAEQELTSARQKLTNHANGSRPLGVYLRELATILAELAELARAQGRDSEAKELMKEAIERQRAALRLGSNLPIDEERAKQLQLRQESLR